MGSPVPTHIGNQRGRRVTLYACLGLAVAMVGAAYASVPLYNLFCKVTGYDGTPLVRDTAAGETLSRTVRVSFDTNVASTLDWSFKPETTRLDVKVGETQTVFFRVKNEGSRPATGIAAYNVQPGQIGAYFVKMKCFCFEEQTIQPGEAIDFPVVFYIDPSLAKDRNLDDLSEVTLSYTYFASRNGQPVTSADVSKPKS
jgi:cytochrome c oxidase assembly protein subunit 11